MRLIPLLLATLTISAAYGQAPAQPAPPVKLTLPDAEALALKNHPQVQAAQASAAAMSQRIAEARSVYYPQLAGESTGSQGNPQSRIGAGALTDSRLFNRIGEGFVLSQLITDWGRTPNLVASSRLQASAADQTSQATKYDVLLRVNQTYYAVLRAQATVKVAQQTVDSRQKVADQISELFKNKLKSELDVSFANYNLSDAKLLLLQAQDQIQTAFADLTRALGSQQPAGYELADEPVPASPTAGPEELVAQAINSRPELASLQLNRDAAQRFEQAEKALSYPTASFMGVGGYIPYINQITLPRRIPPEYEGVGVNVQIPILNGGLFKARRQEAHYHVIEADQRLRDEAEAIARDVRTVWGSASVAYQRLAVTAEQLKEATLGMELAQLRYDNGLSTIVELSQAQLNLTTAQVQDLNARYDYQTQYATMQYAIGALR